LRFGDVERLGELLTTEGSAVIDVSPRKTDCQPAMTGVWTRGTANHPRGVNNAPLARWPRGQRGVTVDRRVKARMPATLPSARTGVPGPPSSLWGDRNTASFAHEGSAEGGGRAGVDEEDDYDGGGGGAGGPHRRRGSCRWRRGRRRLRSPPGGAAPAASP